MRREGADHNKTPLPYFFTAGECLSVLPPAEKPNKSDSEHFFKILPLIFRNLLRHGTSDEFEYEQLLSDTKNP
jgi:hypothetical protein